MTGCDWTMSAGLERRTGHDWLEEDLHELNHTLYHASNKGCTGYPAGRIIRFFFISEIPDIRPDTEYNKLDIRLSKKLDRGKKIKKSFCFWRKNS